MLVVLTSVVEDQRGRHEGQRDRNQRDEGGAPLEEEEHQHECDEQDAERERLREVLERQLDEARRTEDRRVDLEVLESWPHLGEGLLDPAGHVQRVAPRELFDDEQQAVAVVDDRVTGEQLVPLDHFGDVPHDDSAAAVALDDDLRDGLGRLEGQDVLHHVPLVAGVDVSAGPDLGARAVLRSPASVPADAAPITSSSVTPAARIRSGSIWIRHGSCACPRRRRWRPRGRDISCGRILYRTIVACSMRSIDSELTPIFMTRLVADSGWRTTGGVAQLGRVGVIVWIGRRPVAEPR